MAPKPTALASPLRVAGLSKALLKQRLELKAEQHLRAQHLHAQLVERELEALSAVAHRTPWMNASCACQAPLPASGIPVFRRSWE
jgi:hypothetical protein